MNLTFDITAFRAIGDGKTINTEAMVAAAAACREQGGGTIVVPAGNFVTGVFQLFSNTTLRIEKGGRLIGSPNRQDHQVGTASCGLLYALDASDIRLTGEGVLDGNAVPFFSTTEIVPLGSDFLVSETRQGRDGRPYGYRDISHGPKLPLGRPGNMLVFGRCKGLTVEGVTVTGATYWTIHCADCEDVTFKDVKIENDVTIPNNDGIHLTTCRNVRIDRCNITCGDDSIAITGFNHPLGEMEIALGLSGIVGECRDIVVQDCRLSSRSAGVRMGYGPNPVRNVTLRNLQITGSNRGIGIFASQSDVSDIVVTNCSIKTRLFHGNWWGRGEPVQISAVRYPGVADLHHVRNVLIEDVSAIGENAFTLYAEEEGAIDGIKLVRIEYTLTTGELFETWGGNLDLRPAADKKIAVHAGGTAPLWSIGVTHLEQIDCSWRTDANAEKVNSREPFIRSSAQP